jgi:hypothetical protein
MKARNLLIGFSLICVGPSPAFAVPLNGGVVDFYQSFTGSLSPVEVDLGSGPVSTGLISYSLDATNPSAQQFGFNFSSLTATAQLDLVVNFPLLQTLGAPPLKIQIVESGPIVSGVPDLPVGDNQSLTFRALLTGGGTVGPGSVFSGFTFSNLNDTTTVKNVNVAPGGTYNQTVTGGGNITITATITQPGKPPVPTGGTGTFGVGPNPLPEPSSMILLGSGLAALAGYRWGRIK